MKTYYLAGPMSGIPQFNFPMFHRVAALLRGQGRVIWSPAEHDSPAVQNAAMKSKDGTLDANGKIAGETWGDILAKDVKVVADTVQGIIFLPGWERSRGARLEAFVGLLQKDFEFLRWDESAGNPVPISRRTIQNEIHNSWGD